MPTPVKAGVLKEYLQASGYSESKTQFLFDGFSKGFRLQHWGDPCVLTEKNAKSVGEKEEIVWDKIQHEIGMSRIAGPFDEPPFSPFQVSPLDIREKKQPGKHRLIHNLSYPYDQTAVNSNIADEDKTVKYATIFDAVNLVTSSSTQAYMAKTDIKDAFRLICISPKDYAKLGFVFRGKYYHDKVLPMGCGSSCKIFETFSSGLQHVFESLCPGSKVVHMLDDFLFVADEEEVCKRHLEIFLEMCKTIGVPIAKEKTSLPAKVMCFLGVELDSVYGCCRLPQDKVQSYASVLHDFLDRKRATKHELQSLVGKLSFAVSVVPGRPFLRRLIDVMTTVKKQCHFVNIGPELKKDLRTWLTFLSRYNGVTYFRMLSVSTDEIRMCSDASFMGFGATFGKKWLQARYPENWQSMGITVLEFFPILVLVSMFSDRLANTNVLWLCDNEAVTVIINKQTSKNKNVMVIMRDLVLILMRQNIYLKAEHLPGLSNHVCDTISRFHVTEDFLRENGLDHKPTMIAMRLLPSNYVIS